MVGAAQHREGGSCWPCFPDGHSSLHTPGILQPASSIPTTPGHAHLSLTHDLSTAAAPQPQPSRTSSDLSLLAFRACHTDPPLCDCTCSPWAHFCWTKGRSGHCTWPQPGTTQWGWALVLPPTGHLTGPWFSTSTGGQGEWHGGNCVKDSRTAKKNSWEVSSEPPRRQWRRCRILPRGRHGTQCQTASGSPWTLPQPLLLPHSPAAIRMEQACIRSLLVLLCGPPSLKLVCAQRTWTESLTLVPPTALTTPGTSALYKRAAVLSSASPFSGDTPPSS